MISAPFPEISELRLPHHQVVGGHHRVPVLEADTGVLRQGRVADGEPAALQAGQGHVLGSRGVIHQHRMALGEGAPPGVLPGEADVRPLEQQGTDGQSLAQSPVDLTVGHHLVPLLELAGQLGVDDEALRNGAHLGGQPGHHGGIDPVSTDGVHRSGTT